MSCQVVSLWRRFRARATAELERAESCFESGGRAAARGGQQADAGATDVKTRRVVGYVAVALACANGCSGSPAPSIFGSATKDSGAPDGRGRELTVTDARAGDESDVDSGGSEGGAADDTTNASPGSTSSQNCCVSGAFYLCPNAATIARCTSDCTRDPSKDANCPASSGSGSSGSGASTIPPPPTNACGGPYTGFACGTGDTCIVGHCTGSLCFPNDVGNPCTWGTDCGDGNHCTAGCCANPAAGSACTAPWDCKSGTCTNGVCQ
jgi:hypothetical protein